MAVVYGDDDDNDGGWCDAVKQNISLLCGMVV